MNETSQHSEAWRIAARAEGLSEGDLDAYLGQTCGADLSLRRAVESLLSEEGDDDPVVRVEARSARDADQLRELRERLLLSPGPAAAGPRREQVRELLTRIRRLDRIEDRFEVGRTVGQGGMGTVHEVFDRELGRTLAMKVLDVGATRLDQTPPDLIWRFLQEARVTAQLFHPGIVSVHEVLRSGEQLLYTMDLLEGQDYTTTLRSVDRSDARSLAGAVASLRSACEAVAYAHSRGVIHRDLKPENIRIGGHGEVWVIDWGIAHVGTGSGVDATAVPLDAGDERPMRTRAGHRPGTPPFMAPERFTSDVLDARVDVYSLGAILCQLLTGASPDPTTTSTPASRPPISAVNPKAPPELVAIADRAMAPEPDERYPTVKRLADDLERFERGRVVTAYASGPVAELRKWFARNQPVSSIVVGVSLLLVIVFSVLGDRSAQLLVAEGTIREKEAEAAMSRATFLQVAGDWPATLLALDAAAEAGFEDEIGLELARVLALEGLGELDEVDRRVAALAARSTDELGKHRARVLLWMGDASRGSGKKLAGSQLLHHVEAALELGQLDPADERYARALIATDIASTVSHLGAAINHAPRHRRANEMLAPVLLASGDVESAYRAARVYRSLFQRDPSAQLNELACEAILKRRYPADGAERFPNVDDAARVALHTYLSLYLTIDDLLDVPVRQVARQFVGLPPDPMVTADATTAMMSRGFTVAFSPAAGGQWETLFRLPPRIAERYSACMGASVFSVLGMSPERALNVLADAEGLGDAFYLYARGQIHVRADDLAAAARDFFAAAEGRSIFSLARPAHALGMAVAHRAGTLRPAEAASHIRSYLRREQLQVDELRFLAEIADGQSLPALVRLVTRRAAVTDPAHPWVRFAVMKTHLMDSDTTAARRDLSALLRDHPEHPELEEARELAAVLLRDD